MAFVVREKMHFIQSISLSRSHSFQHHLQSHPDTSAAASCITIMPLEEISPTKHETWYVNYQLICILAFDMYITKEVGDEGRIRRAGKDDPKAVQVHVKVGDTYHGITGQARPEWRIGEHFRKGSIFHGFRDNFRVEYDIEEAVPKHEAQEEEVLRMWNGWMTSCNPSILWARVYPQERFKFSNYVVTVLKDFVIPEMSTKGYHPDTGEHFTIKCKRILVKAGCVYNGIATNTDDRLASHISRGGFFHGAEIEMKVVSEGRDYLEARREEIHAISANAAAGKSCNPISLSAAMRAAASLVELPPGINKCPFCDVITNRKDHLKRHIKYVHEGDKQQLHTCTTCEYASIRIGSVRRHIKYVHEWENRPKFLCPLCVFTSIYKRNIIRHIENALHKEPKHKCILCGFSSSRKEDLYFHEIKEHGVDNRPKHSCRFCNYSSPRPDHVARHEIQNHSQATNRPDFQCKSCAFSSPDRPALVEHIKEHHKVHTCLICGYKTSKKGNYNRHMATVHRVDTISQQIDK